MDQGHQQVPEAIIRTTDEPRTRLFRVRWSTPLWEAADFGQELLYFTDKAACPDPAHRVVPTEVGITTRILASILPRASA